MVRTAVAATVALLAWGCSAQGTGETVVDSIQASSTSFAMEASSTTATTLSSTTTSTVHVEPFTHRLQPVDPRSFEFIEAQTGPEASWWFNHALDRNHRFLGLLSGAEPYRGMLRVFDMDWKLVSGPVPGDDPFASLRLGSDGSAYWLQSACCGDPFRLHHLPAGAPESQELAVLPDEFAPYGLTWLSPDASSYVTLGIVSEDGLAGGPALLVAIDTSSGQMTTRPVDISIGIVSGLAEVVERYTPGLVIDDEEKLLYVVHADRDMLSILDLETLETVSTRPITKPQGFLDRLLAWWIPSAHAKLERGTLHDAVLGADGMLYVATSVSDAGQGSDGESFQTSTPLGLRVIDPETGLETGRLDIPVDHVVASGDDHLVAAGTTWSSLSGVEESHVYVISTDPLEVAHQIPTEQGQSVWLSGVSPDGASAYVTSLDEEKKEDTVRAIDISTGDVTGIYTVPDAQILPELPLMLLPQPDD